MNLQVWIQCQRVYRIQISCSHLNVLDSKRSLETNTLDFENETEKCLKPLSGLRSTTVLQYYSTTPSGSMDTWVHCVSNMYTNERVHSRFSSLLLWMENMIWGMCTNKCFHCVFICLQTVCLKYFPYDSVLSLRWCVCVFVSNTLCKGMRLLINSKYTTNYINTADYYEFWQFLNILSFWHVAVLTFTERWRCLFVTVFLKGRIQHKLRTWRLPIKLFFVCLICLLFLFFLIFLYIYFSIFVLFFLCVEVWKVFDCNKSEWHDRFWFSCSVFNAVAVKVLQHQVIATGVPKFGKYREPESFIQDPVRSEIIWTKTVFIRLLLNTTMEHLKILNFHKFLEVGRNF